MWETTRDERPTFGLRWLQKLLETHTHLVHRALSLDDQDDFDLLGWIQNLEGRDDFEGLDDDDDDDYEEYE